VFKFVAGLRDINGEKMKAIELSGLEGFKSLRVVDAEKPKPGPNQVLIQVKAAGINFAELELTWGRYPALKPLPYVLGFEAAGVIVEAGSQVKNLEVGDAITSIVSSGGYAEYATADANFAIPVPKGVSFAEASTIPIQGLSAHALLKFAAKPQAHETILVQAAAGGVGLYLVQLAKIIGVKQVIALASAKEKLDLVKSLGADVAINYSDKSWPDQVRKATEGKGVDVVLEAASGDVGDESFKLVAPFGRIVFFGSRNIHDTIPSEKIQQLIYKNQSLIGFNIPTIRPEHIGECVPELLNLIAQGRVKLFANTTFPLAEVKKAYEALSSRHTIGKVVLTP
jgi:NADPH2:quinone reductase